MYKHVTCHMSCVTCHVSHVTCFLCVFFTESLERLLSMGPTRSIFFYLSLLLFTIFYIVLTTVLFSAQYTSPIMVTRIEPFPGITTYTALHYLHCTLYTVHTVHCTFYTVHWSLPYLNSTLYTVHSNALLTVCCTAQHCTA